VQSPQRLFMPLPAVEHNLETRAKKCSLFKLVKSGNKVPLWITEQSVHLVQPLYELSLLDRY
jgi:hypothetical protein